MIVGAFAGLSFGIPRTTFDINIIVDLNDQDFAHISGKFPLPRYYAHSEMMGNSTKMGIMFNIIDTQEGLNADLVPFSREPEYRIAFERRIRRDYSGAETDFSAWRARPEDVIIGKFHAWQEGRSSKHPSEIHSMLLYPLSAGSDTHFDIDVVTKAAARLGEDVFELWNQLLVRARSEIEK